MTADDRGTVTTGDSHSLNFSDPSSSSCVAQPQWLQEFQQGQSPLETDKLPYTFYFQALGVRDGICVDPQLQGFYESRIIGLVCEGETVGKTGEVDEMGERELVLVVSVRCGKE